MNFNFSTRGRDLGSVPSICVRTEENPFGENLRVCLLDGTTARDGESVYI
jgi:hypothetical protein